MPWHSKIYALRENMSNKFYFPVSSKSQFTMQFKHKHEKGAEKGLTINRMVKKGLFLFPLFVFRKEKWKRGGLEHIHSLNFT